MARHRFSRLGVIAVFALVIVVNYLSNALPINGVTMTEMSAKYPTLFTPAGFTFSVWGVIYAALLGFVIFQALPAQKDNVAIARIVPLFIVNGLANAVWIVIWHYDMVLLALAVMGVILGTLILIYRRLRAAQGPRGWAERLCLYLPFSLYLAWITAASIANLSIVQVDMGWVDLGLSEIDWTYLKLATAGAIGVTMAVRYGDIAFVLVIAWAAYGISVKQAGTPLISGAAMVLAVLGVLLAAVEAVRKLRLKA